MKTLSKLAGGLFLALLFSITSAFAQIPPFPADPYLDSWSFADATNWTSDLGCAPIAFTNILCDEAAWSSDDGVLNCNGLILDSTNEAFLNYRVTETNGHANLSLTNGTVWFWFSPNWTSASADVSGSGPGDWGRFIDAGAYATNAAFGWWSLLVSPDGNTIYFSGQTNGAGTNYLNAPISWTAGSWHLIGLAYTATNSILYLDGAVATNGLGVCYWPGDEALTNGFWLGSDFSGTQQAHGEFVDVEAWLDEEWGDDFFAYYYNLMLPELPGSFFRDSFSPPDFSSGGGTNFPDWYGTNVLWLYIAGVESNTAGLFLVNTEPDVSYEIQSKTDLTLTNWTSEGFVLGSELTNWTEMDVAQGNRTNNLFFRIRSWADDGSGLPVWWQEQYFGATGVDPYGDPDGDGWNNLQEFQNGTDPNSFDTPPAPQVSVAYNNNTSIATVSWLPSSGPVTNYLVGKYDDQTGVTTNFNLAPTATSFQDNLSGDTADLEYGPQLYVYYSIEAEYAGGNSASGSAFLEYIPTSPFSLINGPGGNLYVAAKNLPNDLQKLVFYRQSQQYSYEGVTYWPYENGSGYPVDLTDGYFTVLTAAITNGIAQIPASQAYAFGRYEFWVQTVSSNGLSSAWVDLGRPSVNAFVDLSQQMKDNVRFLFRDATEDSPFNINTLIHSTNYVYSGFQSQYGSFDPLLPIEENYIYRNFAFDLTNLSTSAVYDYLDQIYVYVVMPTGVYLGDEGGNYSLDISNYPPITFDFAGLITTNSPIAPASVLTTNATTWTYNLQGLLLWNGWGQFYTPPYFTITNGQNFYGLPYLSDEIVIETNGNQLNYFTSYPGDNIPFTEQYEAQYLQTTQPSLSQVGYYFARTGVDPIPEQSTYTYGSTPPVAFAITNTTSLMIAGVGQSMPQISGYAKFALLNGVSNKFAYVGQYFDKAYQIDTNGIVTTNTTGVLSPYGDFFPTQPGPVALVTMPDIDTGARGTGIVYAVSLQLDANHDGNMDLSFNGSDATSAAKPMKFWVNSGWDDANGVDQENYGFTNYMDGQINWPRDLENFARLWVCGMPSLPSAQGYSVTLSWQNVNGTPAINLFRSCETNGGTGYLTDTNVAAAQTDFTFPNGAGLLFGHVASGGSFTFPADFFDGTNKYFLFEGAGIGSGQLTLTISQSGNTIAQSSVWLDLHDIKDFYEQAHAANVPTSPPSTNTSVLVEDKVLPTNSAEDQQVIVYVHGLNTSLFEYYDTSETMFKRLYWQGYQGRLAAFRWPSPLFALIPTGTNEISYLGFNTGEYVSWHSGTALKAYINDLHNRLPGYTVNLAVHSLGNVAANEAIREGAQVDNYALMQAAISAGAFEGNNSALTYDYLAATASSSPGADSLGGYGNCFTNATRRVNFYNDDDFALYRGAIFSVTVHTWEGNQLDYKPDTYIYLGGFQYKYSFDGTNCFYSQYDGDGDLLSSRIVTEDFEKKAFIARSRTKAVGAAGLKYEPFALTQGSIFLNVSLQDESLGFVGGAAFENTRPEHSGEFTKPIQNTVPFYQQLLQKGFQINQN